MKKIVTTILGASLLAGALYAAGDTMSHGKMMNHTDMNNMTSKQMKHCNDMMRNTSSQDNSWTPPINVLEKLYGTHDDIQPRLR